MARYIFTIRNKVNNQLFAGYGRFSTVGKEFSTEAGAKGALNRFISQQVYQKLRTKEDWTPQDDVAAVFPYDLEIVKHEVMVKEVGVTKVAANVKNAIISRHLRNTRQYEFGSFFENSINKGYADNIKYIFQLDTKRGTPWMDTIKEARAQLRLLGVKTRTFREYNGCFGFYDKDQALKARLTIAVKSFIDMEALKKEKFG